MGKTLGADGRQCGRRGRWPGPGRRSVATVVLALGTAVAALSGCSVKPQTTVSAGGLETTIARDLAAGYGIPRPRVHCPGSVGDKVGAHLTCTTELDGQTLAVAMTITGAHGQASLRPTSAVVTKGMAEAHLASSLARQLKGVQVFCAGPALLVVRPGSSFSCQADAAGVQRQVVVTVANVSGRLHYRVLRYRS